MAKLNLLSDTTMCLGDTGAVGRMAVRGKKSKGGKGLTFDLKGDDKK